MTEKNHRLRLVIPDMDCASCVANIERELNKLDGVTGASVNFALGLAIVSFKKEKISADEILEAVKKLGYYASIEMSKQVGVQPSLFDEGGHKDHEHNEDKKGRWHSKNKKSKEDHSAHAMDEGRKQMEKRRNRFLISLILGVAVLVIGFAVDVPYEMYVMMGLSLLILVFAGNEFFRKGVVNLLKGRPGMDALVALGVGSAFLYSSYLVLFTDRVEEYFMDVAVITTFILFGRYLEALSKGKAGLAIKKLIGLSAKVAHKLDGDDIVDIAVDQIQVGDILIVKPGEKVPTDGIIIEGSGAIDESMITGESIGVEKTVDSKVIGATINGNTVFRMRAEKVGSETMLAHIVRLVQDAQMSKAPIQKLVDVVAGYFVWGVIVVAIAALIIWYVITGDVSRSFTIMVTILIIACPCALGLATPISIVVGSGKGADLGILLKNPEALEKMHKLTVVCFDKTGTITRGKPKVEVFRSVEGDEDSNLGRALSLELASEHPLAESVITYVRKQTDIKAHDVKNFEAIVGKGIMGEIGTQIYYLGSEKLIRELGVSLDAYQEDIRRLYNQGYTVLIFSDTKQVRAYFGVKDTIKTYSKAAVEALKKRDIKPVMVTGDNERVASAIAGEIGISEIFAEVAPEDKVRIIERLQKEGEVVGMIGDGINDSPALAQADVGIALGTGTDVAMESGDVVIVKGDLNKAVVAMELSEATLRNIKQNLFWAFIYNSVGIPIAALGLLNPMISAVAMSFSSVSVVLNALRLRKFKAKLGAHNKKH